jgi:hypothetical protein
MRFQPRDGTIISTIYNYGGVLARRHIQEMFWPHATQRAALKRLAKLVDSAYLAKPSTHQRRTHPLPEPVYWLGWHGVLWLAGQSNIAVKPPTNDGENQMRKLAKLLRDHGIRWLREPRWIQLAHDLAVVDFRRSVEWSVNQHLDLRLERWRNESTFRCDGDVIEYGYKDRRDQIRGKKKRVIPDGYCVITDHRQSAQGRITRARFLLELDHATHSNERFGREKVAPGLAYIKSGIYRERFGDNSGRWLVITTGEVRMKNLMRQTERVAGNQAGVFLFTTFNRLENANVLLRPIWSQVGQTNPVALFDAW